MQGVGVLVGPPIVTTHPQIFLMAGS
jgi:hypothetical protein